MTPPFCWCSGRVPATRRADRRTARPRIGRRQAILLGIRCQWCAATRERSRQYSKQHARAGIPAVARYGEYEEVTTGGNDRWPHARWDFSHFAPFHRGRSEYARGRAHSCARG
jgi:hypothetical protein